MLLFKRKGEFLVRFIKCLVDLKRKTAGQKMVMSKYFWKMGISRWNGLRERRIAVGWNSSTEMAGKWPRPHHHHRRGKCLRYPISSSEADWAAVVPSTSSRSGSLLIIIFDYAVRSTHRVLNPPSYGNPTGRVHPFNKTSFLFLDHDFFF